MNPWTARLVSLLLVALALVFCEPKRAAAATTPLPGIVSGAGAGFTPACGTAADGDLGLPKSKTNLAAVSTGAMVVALIDRTPAVDVPLLPWTVPHQISVEVLVARAPPLV